jgi:hypothetical protein
MRKNSIFVLVRGLVRLRNQALGAELIRFNTDVMWWVMDRREHPRARLRLPARLRWAGPFGQKTELCETLNVSRGGILVPCQEFHAAGVSLWVTFPYDASLPDGQPEVLARVVRSKRAGEFAPGHALRNTNVCPQPAAALHFELAPHYVTANGNGHLPEPERRTSPRRRLALPIRVRPEGVPWFEEAMTVDVSAEGVLFLGSREYQTGQYLRVSFVDSTFAPWPAPGESRSVVARVDPVPGSSALSVGLRRVSS